MTVTMSSDMYDYASLVTLLLSLAMSNILSTYSFGISVVYVFVFVICLLYAASITPDTIRIIFADAKAKRNQDNTHAETLQSQIDGLVNHCNYWINQYGYKDAEFTNVCRTLAESREKWNKSEVQHRNAISSSEYQHNRTVDAKDRELYIARNTIGQLQMQRDTALARVAELEAQLQRFDLLAPRRAMMQAWTWSWTQLATEFRNRMTAHEADYTGTIATVEERFGPALSTAMEYSAKEKAAFDDINVDLPSTAVSIEAFFAEYKQYDAGARPWLWIRQDDGSLAENFQPATITSAPAVSPAQISAPVPEFVPAPAHAEYVNTVEATTPVDAVPAISVSAPTPASDSAPALPVFDAVAAPETGFVQTADTSATVTAQEAPLEDEFSGPPPAADPSYALSSAAVVDEQPAPIVPTTNVLGKSQAELAAENLARQANMWAGRTAAPPPPIKAGNRLPGGPKKKK